MDLVPSELKRPLVQRLRPFRWGRHALLATALWLGVSGSGACRTGASPTLAHTMESPEAVARAVVRGFAERNLGALRELAVTDAEFRIVVWPKLPASRPERNLPLDYVWKDLAAKSDDNLRARLAKWEDRGFVLASLFFKGGVTDYGTFKVHRDTELRLRDQAGNEETGRLFGSIIEYEGRFKIFSYVVD